MKFHLKQQAIDILIDKYKVKSSLIKQIENKVNAIRIVKNVDDYLILIQNIVATIFYLNKQKEEFGKGKDRLIIKITIDDVIKLEICRRYGYIYIDNEFVKPKIKLKQ